MPPLSSFLRNHFSPVPFLYLDNISKVANLLLNISIILTSHGNKKGPAETVGKGFKVKLVLEMNCQDSILSRKSRKIRDQGCTACSAEDKLALYQGFHCIGLFASITFT